MTSTHKVDTIDENAINIYTDGSSYSTPRIGGIGIRFITVGSDGYEIVEEVQLPGYKGATNQQMELKACVEALTLLNRGRTNVDVDAFGKIIIKTDSMYLVNGYQSARHYWAANRWMTKDGSPVISADLWKIFLRLAANSGKRVEVQWVKAHKKSVHNNAADKLAKKSAKGPLNPPLNVVSVRRKQTKKSVERGSVHMNGQRVTLRIISCEYLRVQRCWRYKYEVMSKASSYFGNVDWIFSEISLRDGHTYYVRLNDETPNPRILKLYREVT